MPGCPLCVNLPAATHQWNERRALMHQLYARPCRLHAPDRKQLGPVRIRRWLRSGCSPNLSKVTLPSRLADTFPSL